MLTSPTVCGACFISILFLRRYLYNAAIIPDTAFSYASSPLLLTQMAQVGSGVFSSIFSGQAGTVDLAGVAVGVNIWYPVFAGMCGVFLASHRFSPQLRGAGKQKISPGIFYKVSMLQSLRL